MTYSIEQLKAMCPVNIAQCSKKHVESVVADLIETALAAAPAAPQQQPFGYFKTEPFGWVDCAETDDGAIALYTAPPVSDVEPVAYVTGYNNGYPTIAPINSALCMAIGTALYSAPPAPSVPDGLHLLISGAVYDFAGFLTTREKTIQVGARVGADIVVDLLKEWAALRGLKLDDAAVLSWQEWLSPTPPEPPADVARDARLQVESEFAALLPGVTYMDEPDGGSPTVQEQVKRMALDAERYRWLRNEAWGCHVASKGLPHVVEFKVGMLPSMVVELAEDALDAAIDAAMAREAGNG